MYKIIDLQGGGLLGRRIFKTEQEAHEALLAFHEPDLKEGVVYTLDDLLEIGMWELEVAK